MTKQRTTTTGPGGEVSPGPTNTLTDVPGIRVGHATRRGAGWLTGVTVVLAPPEGAVGGVDVRGGGSGTRETDLLDPRNVVERVHAVTLAGGTPGESFFVRCDHTTMSANDLDNGRVVALIGVSPTEPIEYIVLRLTVDDEATARVEVSRG